MRFLPRFLLLPLATITLAGLLAACGKGSPSGPAVVDPDLAPIALTFPLCRDTLTEVQLREMLNGNLAIVAGYSAEGLRATDIVGGLVAGFVINTLDFGALDDWDIEFSLGRYRIRNGINTFDVRMIVQQPFGPYQAGDTLKENLFAPSSFVRNVSVNLSGNVSYSPGPLFSLVSGNISWSNLNPRFRIDATKLSMDLVSTGIWRTPSWWPWPDQDTIVARMDSRIDLFELKSDFKNGRIGFSYDSTVYRSRSFKIDQSIFNSLFEMRPLDSLAKRWSWEGGYQSRIDKIILGTEPLRVYVRGSVSTVTGNRTGYFCDAGFQDSVGFTLDDTSGTWGYFKSVRGDSIPYGLIPVTK